MGIINDCLSSYLNICPFACLSVCPSVRLSVHLSIYLFVHLPICPFICLSVHISVHQSVCPSVCHLPVCHGRVCFSFCLSFCLSAFLSTCLFVFLSFRLHVCLFVGRCSSLHLSSHPSVCFVCPTLALTDLVGSCLYCLIDQIEGITCNICNTICCKINTVISFLLSFSMMSCLSSRKRELKKG